MYDIVVIPRIFLCRQIRDYVVSIQTSADSGAKEAQFDCYGFGKL